MVTFEKCLEILEFKGSVSSYFTIYKKLYGPELSLKMKRMFLTIPSIIIFFSGIAPVISISILIKMFTVIPTTLHYLYESMFIIHLHII